MSEPSASTPPRKRPDYEAEARREDPVPESAAWNVLAYLLAGLVGFALPAYVLDRLLGTSWIVLIGLMVGMAVALTTIWFRYGTDRAATTTGSGDAPLVRADRPLDERPVEDSP